MNTRYFGWTITSNNVKKRLKNDSLVHTFSSKTRTKKSTKLFNQELKQITGNITHAAFVRCKKKILKDIAENNYVTDHSDFSDHDYILFDKNDLETVDNNSLIINNSNNLKANDSNDDDNDDLKSELPDDCFTWLFVQKIGRKKIEFNQQEQLQGSHLSFNNTTRNNKESTYNNELHPLNHINSLQKESNYSINIITEDNIENLGSESSVTSSSVISNSSIRKLKEKTTKSAEHKFLCQKETLNQPKDSGIDEESREYTKMSSDLKQYQIESNENKVFIDNRNVLNDEKKDDSEQCKKHSIKIIGEKKIMNKYKIVHNKDDVLKSLVQEKGVLESVITHENKASSSKNEKIENSSNNNIEHIDLPGTPFDEDNASNDEHCNLYYSESDIDVETNNDNFNSKQIISENVNTTLSVNKNILNKDERCKKAIKREAKRSSFLSKQYYELKKMRLLEDGSETSDSESSKITIYRNKNNNNNSFNLKENQEFNDSHIDQSIKEQYLGSSISNEYQEKPCMDFVSDNKCLNVNSSLKPINTNEQFILENEKLSIVNESYSENNNKKTKLISQNTKKNVTALQNIRLNEVLDESLEICNIIPTSQDNVKPNKYNKKEIRDNCSIEKEDQISSKVFESNLLKDNKNKKTLINHNFSVKKSPIIEETEESRSEDESNEIKNPLIQQEESHHSDNSNDIINDYYNDIDIDEHKNVNLLKEELNDKKKQDYITNNYNSHTNMLEPNSQIVNDFEKNTNIDEQNLNNSLNDKSEFDDFNNMECNKIVKLHKENSSALLNDQLLLNENISFSKKHIEGEEPSSDGSSDAYLLNSSIQKETDNEKNQNILQKSSELNDFLEDENHEKKEGNDSGMEMSPSATKKLFSYKRLDLYSADSSSSSEDEEVTIKSKITANTCKEQNKTMKDKQNINNEELEKLCIDKSNSLEIKNKSEFANDIRNNSDTINSKLKKSLNTSDVKEFSQSMEKIDDSAAAENSMSKQHINMNNRYNKKNTKIQNLQSTDSSSSNEDEEVAIKTKIIAKTCKKNNKIIIDEQNVYNQELEKLGVDKSNSSEAKNKSECEKDITKKSDMINSKLRKSFNTLDAKDFSESMDTIEDSMSRKKHKSEYIENNNHENNKNSTFTETLDTLNTEQKDLESQEMFSSIEDLTKKISQNQNLLNVNEEPEYVVNNVDKCSRNSINSRMKETDTKKITKISELIAKENLVNCVCDSTITLNDISEEEEIFILDIPKTAFNKNLIKKKMTISKTTLSLGEEVYEAFPRKITPTFSCLLKLGKTTNHSYKIINIRPNASIVATRKRCDDESSIKLKHLSTSEKKKKKKVLNSRKSQQILEQEQISMLTLNSEKDINFKEIKTKAKKIVNNDTISGMNITVIDQDLNKEKKSLKRKLSLITHNENTKEYCDYEISQNSSKNLSPIKKPKCLKIKNTNTNLDIEKSQEEFTNEEQKHKKKKNEIVTANASRNLKISNDIKSEIEQIQSKDISLKRKCKYIDEQMSPKNNFMELTTESLSITKNKEGENELNKNLNSPVKKKNKIDETKSTTTNIKIKKGKKKTEKIESEMAFNEIEQINDKAVKLSKLNIEKVPEKFKIEQNEKEKQNNEIVTANESLNLKISNKTKCETAELKSKKISLKKKYKYIDEQMSSEDTFKESKTEPLIITTNKDGTNHLNKNLNSPVKKKKKIDESESRTTNINIKKKKKKTEKIESKTAFNEIKEIIGKVFKSDKLDFSHSNEKKCRYEPLNITHICPSNTKRNCFSSSSDDEKEFVQNSFKVRQKSNDSFNVKKFPKSSTLFDTKDNSETDTTIKMDNKDKKIYFEE